MRRSCSLLLAFLVSTSAAAQLPTDTLLRGNGPEPSTLDAHRCPEVACGNILRDLYEGLVAEDARGQVIPGMAERWEQSPDGRIWTAMAPTCCKPGRRNRQCAWCAIRISMKLHRSPPQNPPPSGTEAPQPI